MIISFVIGGEFLTVTEMNLSENREEAYFKSCKSDSFLCLGLSDVGEEIEDIFKGVYDFLHKRRNCIFQIQFHSQFLLGIELRARIDV